MSVFAARDFRNHENVVFASDDESGLKAIIAVHDSTLGPALGGCRMWPYSSEQEAVDDVLRLSRGMTYKNALAGLALGGGKSVIIGDARTQKTPALMQAMGRAVERLGGAYIVAEDVGTSVDDMIHIRKTTDHVVGLPIDAPYNGSGDPSPATAYGVFMGLQAAVAYRLRRNDMSGIRVAVQGLGHVGYHLCRHLSETGADLTVTDIRKENVDRVVDTFGATAVATDAIVGADVDVFAPCALGAVLNDATIPQLKAKVVAGAANNQLAEDRHGTALAKRGILYAPDYVINAGGVINITHEREAGGYSREAAFAHVAQIHDTLMHVFRRAEATGHPTNQAADHLAEERLAA